MKKLVAAVAFFMASSAAHAMVQWVDLLADPNNLAEGAYSSLVLDDFTVTAGGFVVPRSTPVKHSEI